MAIIYHYKISGSGTELRTNTAVITHIFSSSNLQRRVCVSVLALGIDDGEARAGGFSG